MVAQPNGKESVQVCHTSFDMDCESQRSLDSNVIAVFPNIICVALQVALRVALALLKSYETTLMACTAPDFMRKVRLQVARLPPWVRGAIAYCCHVSDLIT